MGVLIASVRVFESAVGFDAAVIYDSVTDTPMGRFFFDMVLDPDDEDTPFKSASDNAKDFLAWFSGQDFLACFSGNGRTYQGRTTYDLRNMMNGDICRLMDEWHRTERDGWQVA